MGKYYDVIGRSLDVLKKLEDKNGFLPDGTSETFCKTLSVEMLAHIADELDRLNTNLEKRSSELEATQEELQKVGEYLLKNNGCYTFYTDDGKRHILTNIDG